MHTTTKDSKVIMPSNPSYMQIYDRIIKETNEKNLLLNDLIHYDQEFQNPYIRYYNDVEGV
ncbi:MAG: hypothetical protein PHI90_06015 [Clostridia bacterium]|nr:hypothetical protein [Clostridia bacterium]MDD4048365.1 hypothetical protein [Clostridia bacterium]